MGESYKFASLGFQTKSDSHRTKVFNTLRFYLNHTWETLNFQMRSNQEMVALTVNLASFLPLQLYPSKGAGHLKTRKQEKTLQILVR